jgi:hypothetical protein
VPVPIGERLPVGVALPGVRVPSGVPLPSGVAVREVPVSSSVGVAVPPFGGVAVPPVGVAVPPVGVDVPLPSAGVEVAVPMGVPVPSGVIAGVNVAPPVAVLAGVAVPAGVMLPGDPVGVAGLPVGVPLVPGSAVLVTPGLPVAVDTALPVGVDAGVPVEVDAGLPVDVAGGVGDPPAGVAVLVRVGPLVVAVAIGETLGDALPFTTGVAVGVGEGDSMPGGAVVVRSGVGVRVRTKNVPVAVRVGGPRRGVRVTVGVRVNSGMPLAGRPKKQATIVTAKQVERTRRQYALIFSSPVGRGGCRQSGSCASAVSALRHGRSRYSRDAFADCPVKTTEAAGSNCSRARADSRRKRAPPPWVKVHPASLRDAAAMLAQQPARAAACALRGGSAFDVSRLRRLLGATFPHYDSSSVCPSSDCGFCRF